MRLLLLIPLLTSLLGFGQLRFNEVVSINNSGIQDLEGDYTDWIELAIDSLDDSRQYFISDDADDLTQWQIPFTSSERDTLILIFASKKDIDTNGWHTNFKISREGESLFLSTDQGQIIDAWSIPELHDHDSYGLVGDTGSPLILDHVTPRETNTDTIGYYGYHPGFVVHAQNQYGPGTGSYRLETSQPNTSYLYGLNGNTNPEQMSALVDTLVDSTIVIHLAARTDSLLYSPASTIAFYKSEISTLPVMFVSTDSCNLWSEEKGMYIKGPNAEEDYPYWGANYWQDWEVEVKVDCFDPRLDTNFQFGAGLEMHGGRSSRTASMKPLRLLIKEKYGHKKLDYPFFEARTKHDYNRLILRNSGGDFNKVHFRDGLVHSMILNEGIDIDVLAFQPTVVYLNGEYWGLHHLREKIDEHYIEITYGPDDEQVDLLEEEVGVIGGDRVQWEAMTQYAFGNDLSQNLVFDSVSQMLDVPSFTDYFVIQSFINNSDWLNNNIKYYKPKVGGKWRYILFDLDFAFWGAGWTGPEANDLLGAFEFPKDTTTHSQLMEAMLGNEDYKSHFINRYCDLTNTFLSEENIKWHSDSIIDLIDNEMTKHLPRWGSSRKKWEEDHLQDKLYSFIEQRPDIALNQLSGFFSMSGVYELSLSCYPEEAGKVSINTLSERVLPWRGKYVSGNEISIRQQANSGYVFSHWITSTGRAFKADTLNYDFHEDTELIAYYSEGVSEVEPMTVFPNPTTQFSNVVLPQSDMERVSMFDQIGREVYTLSTDEVDNNHFLTIDLSDLDPGIYFGVIYSSEEPQKFSITKI